MFKIKGETKRLLNGCIVKSKSGVNMYTPDGVGNYCALWTRDFTYMVENAGDLIPAGDIEGGIQYLLDGADENGWIPDRVEADGTPRYTAGGPDFPASPNLDNGCFLVLCAHEYLKTLDEQKATHLFLKWKDALCKGIDCLPKDETGLVENEAQPPHSPYGFTDTVCKTGRLCFESLLLWRAQKALCKWLEKCALPAEQYRKGYDSIEKNLLATFMGSDGMLKAATGTCAQTDIWASCYAVSIGFPMTENEKKRIADWLIANYATIVEAGQIRHLPENEYWEKTFVPVEKSTYQNGAYWATPTPWFVEAIMPYNRELAMKTLKDILQYFEQYGIFECVNGEYRKLDTYVASVTNIYGLCKKYMES